MADRSSEERIGHNESIFRAIYERAEEISTAVDGPTEFVCECARPDCTQRIDVPADVYERVRARSTHFLVAPGHEQLEYERVVDQRNGWLVVAKIGATREVADDEDPRTG